MWRDKDILGGGVFTLMGVAAFVMAQNYNPGSALNMGPGYMPRIVSAAIVLLGLVQVGGALMRRTERELLDSINWRALALVLLSIAAFALLIRSAGVIPAVTAMIVIAWWADPARNLRHLPALLVVGNLMPILIFNVGLGMHLALWRVF